jgi:hypothetical protein
VVSLLQFYNKSSQSSKAYHSWQLAEHPRQIPDLLRADLIHQLLHRRDVLHGDPTGLLRVRRTLGAEFSFAFQSPAAGFMALEPGMDELAALGASFVGYAGFLAIGGLGGLVNVRETFLKRNVTLFCLNSNYQGLR